MLFNFHLNKSDRPLDYGVLKSSQAEGSQGISRDGFESVVPCRLQGVISKSCEWKADGLQMLFVLK